MRTFMNSPIFALLPLALILLPCLYFVLRASRNAKENLRELVASGFALDAVFDMSDTIVALDMKQQRIAFVNVLLQVFPPGRSSYSTRFNIVEPFSKLEQLDVHLSANLISLSVHLNAPSTFNSKLKMDFNTALQSKSAVDALMAAWPGAGKASFVEQRIIGG